MKHFYVAVALLAASFCASAQAYRSVAVNLKDNTKVEINLTDDFTATFEEGNFVVSGVDTDITVPAAKIKSFSFSKDVAGLGNVAADTEAPVFNGDSMMFNNLPEGSVVEVYNLAGALLFSEHVSGSYTLDLSTLTASPVIVKVNQVAYKIATK